MAKLGAIRRAGAYLPCRTRKMLYQAFVLPHIDYCSVLWNSCGSTLSDKIERVQNYALRLILKKPPLTSSEPLRAMIGFGWTTLKCRRHRLLLNQVHRCVNNYAPSYLCTKFTRNSNLNYTATRGLNKLHLYRPETEYYRSTFEYQGAVNFISKKVSDH